MHFNSLESKAVDQRIRQSLNGKEQELYSKLLMKVSPEGIMLSVGVNFHDQLPQYWHDQGINVSNISDVCRDIRENSVICRRNITAGLGVFTAVRNSDANPRMIYRMIFSHAPGIGNPIHSEKAVLDWNGIKNIHSALGYRFVELDKVSLKWFTGLPLKQEYSSELELIEPMLALIESIEGRSLIEHLHRCNATVCRCSEGKERLNHLIRSATRWQGQHEKDYRICDALIREDSEETKLGFVMAITGVYREVSKTGTSDKAKENMPAPGNGKPDLLDSGSH